jgi:hypothetical protein
MDKETTTVLHGSLFLNAHLDALARDDQPLAVQLVSYGPLPSALGEWAVVPSSAQPPMGVPAVFIAQLAGRARSSRGPETFLGALSVHLAAGFILMVVAAVAAHIVLSWK